MADDRRYSTQDDRAPLQPGEGLRQCECGWSSLDPVLADDHARETGHTMSVPLPMGVAEAMARCRGTHSLTESEAPEALGDLDAVPERVGEIELLRQRLARAEGPGGPLLAASAVRRDSVTAALRAQLHELGWELDGWSAHHRSWEASRAFGECHPFLRCPTSAALVAACCAFNRAAEAAFEESDNG